MQKFTLDTFYHSDEWAKFRAQYIAERLLKFGELVDDQTGEPITKQRDAILHHKVHLTEENVNDVTVSLNPENIELVSARQHNLIHGKTKYYGRRIYITSKDPSTIDQEFDLVIDFDLLHKALGDNDRTILNVWRCYNLLTEDLKRRYGKWATALLVCKKSRIEFNHIRDMLEAEEI